ncbi:mRNA turnover and ribosome assembly protein [Blyttiomyces sp. JEL0837]|nr:mRNA turnover and ribosome assembly protein [Blyttiomyces sp. JEL0837]
MPKSKRNKVVNLTKTERKGKDAKVVLFDRIRTAADKYPHVYVISVSNMRNISFQAVREDMKSTSRFFYGSNKVMAKALGGTEEEEYKEGLRHIAGSLKGNVGLLFSELELEAVEETFRSHTSTDFARAGVIATRTVSFPAGPVMRRIEPVDIEDLPEEMGPSYLPVAKEEIMPFPNNMETQLRGLGMPTLLKGGVISLIKPYTICEQGDTLNPSQAQLLKHFQFKMARFEIRVVAHWFDGKFVKLNDEVDGDEEEMVDAEDGGDDEEMDD